MFTAYLDEAGTDNSKPAVAVGCYISPQEQWDRFVAEWERLRFREKVEFYHRTDQESLKGQFKDWTAEQKVRSYQDQHRIIKTRAQKGFAGAVIKADYNRAITGADLALLGNAYEFCLRHCLSGIAVWFDQWKCDQNVLYVFESGAAGQGHFHQVMELFDRDPELK